MYCIPYLQLDTIAAYSDSLSPKLYSDCDLMFVSIALVSILEEKARFPNAYISQIVPESPIMIYLKRKA